MRMRHQLLLTNGSGETFKQKWDTPGPLETDLHPMAGLPSRRQAIVNATVGTERTTALTRHRGLLDAFIIVSADWATQLNKHVGLVGAEIATKLGKLTDCSTTVQKALDRLVKYRGIS